MWASVVFTVLTVLDSGSKQPIAEASVTISRGEEVLARSETDAKGQVALPDLPPGTYRIRAEKDGYLDLLDPHARGRLFAELPGAILLTPAAVIAGGVFDAQGNPLEGAEVIALVRRSVDGAVRFVRAGQPARVDDRGNYRLFGLAPAIYSVAAVPTADIGMAAPVTYGSFFELKAGETRTGVNLTGMGSQAGSIVGKVAGIPENAGPAAVMLFTKGSLRVPAAAAETGAGGEFVLHDVPPGEYQLSAWTPFGGDYDSSPEGEEARAASRTVTVSSGEAQADLELRPLVKFNGRIARDAACGAQTLIFRPEEGWPEDWKFEAEAAGMPPGRYRAELDDNACRVTPAGFTVPDAPGPVLAVRAATGEIAGDAAGKFVALWPVDGDGDPRMAPVDAEGRYQFAKVLAGSYYLKAVERIDSAGFADALAPGVKVVMVTAGQKVSADLRPVP